MSKLNNSSRSQLPILPFANVKPFQVWRRGSSKLFCQLTRWKNILLILFLFSFLANSLDVQRQGLDHSMPWGKPDTRQSAIDVMSHETSAECL